MLKIILSCIVTLSLAVATVPAEAALTTSLQDLVVQGNALRSSLATIQVNNGGVCGQLGTLNTSIEDYLSVVQGVYNQLAAPLTLTSADLTSLEDLSGIARDLAADSIRLSLELRTVEGVADLFEYRSALSAMLRLSDDIGTMADRILEMADRILTMADNIGLMADRILATQRIQAANIALTQNAILSTQTNMIALSKSLSTIGYNLTLGLLLADTQFQVAEMGQLTLNISNAAATLSYLETKTAALSVRVLVVYDLITKDSRQASLYVDGTTLSYLGDLTVAQKQFAAVLETYAATISRIAPLMQTPLLSDATRSMLRLTADINTMSKRIVEMGDKIIVMADNIGIMSGRIVETQVIQRENVALTLSSSQAAQSTMLALIKNMN